MQSRQVYAYCNLFVLHGATVNQLDFQAPGMLLRYWTPPIHFLAPRSSISLVTTCCRAHSTDNLHINRWAPDVLVVGAGAAGLTAAYFAAENGARVLVLERGKESGRKILMSGGTRW